MDKAIKFASESLETGGVTATEVLEYLGGVGAGDNTLGLLRRKLAAWDNEEADWSKETLRNSEERRSLIYEKLEFGDAWREFCNKHLPFQKLERPTVIAKEHVPWYSQQIQRGRDYYWSRYVEQLRKNGWLEESVSQLDESTRSIVERLADPTGEEAWQSKGLVIGYVQSGKTANFTGVVAKAVDAGYRLIIILGGMLDVLRSQTQRRIDKELVGKELLQREYVNDPDWQDFLSHGAKPSERGAFDLSRLTGPEADYQGLAYGVEALKFESQDHSERFNHPDNLYRAPARIAVLKKHSAVIQKLLTDLSKLGRSRIGAPLDQIPALIIDDESDQGSINTHRQSDASVVQERTATNNAIVSLLTLLPRAQYIGYTATPFANVFVDPSNEEDIFPKDFLISLPRPLGYMGVSDFYDLESGDSDPRPNHRDFVRNVTDRDDKPENLQRAIDCFVLTGAIKLWRAGQDSKSKFRHHTMLVHVSERQAHHKEMAKLARAIYAAAGYDGGKGLDRLLKLFTEDFLPVYGRRGYDLGFPSKFEELEPYLGDCLQRIGESADAVLIINNEHKDETPDFDKQSVWKILVGGTKLSRGYTVEGLTISYYRRRAGAGDTLMQMGRWFGFRRGYADLVRLFIGTAERVGNKTINLYEAFGGVCRDEEQFRKELARYAALEEPRITPANIPPLVPQHMLRPTAPNKMRNAILQFRNFGGQLAESTYAPSDIDLIRRNNDLFAAMLKNKSFTERRLTAEIGESLKTLVAQTAQFSTGELLALLKSYVWYNSRSREAAQPNPLHLQIEFLEGKAGKHEIEDWLLLGPRIGRPRAKYTIHSSTFDVVYRSRHDQQPHRFNTYNDPSHRAFASYISGLTELSQVSDELRGLRHLRRGVMIYYPVTEKQSGSTSEPYTVAFTLLFPRNNIRSQLGFSVRRKGEADDAIVTVDE